MQDPFKSYAHEWYGQRIRPTFKVQSSLMSRLPR